MMEGFSPTSPPRIFWNSRKRSAASRSLDNALKEESIKAPSIAPEESATPPVTEEQANDSKPALSERRKALFEPLDPGTNVRRTAAEILLPPPDFDTMSYPKGWLVGKKRKLVNVDVVESMRKIAVMEMNRKDREIDGLNEQLEEDSRCLEHLQVQLLEERSKRAEVERQNAMLEEQITMLMNILEETQAEAGDAPGDANS